MAFYEEIIAVAFPIPASEVAVEDTLWQDYYLRAALIEAKVTPETPPSEIVAAYRQLVDDALLFPQWFGYMVAQWCGYVRPTERETDFDAAIFEAELRKAGAPELADLWQSDPEVFEIHMEKGRYVDNAQYTMSLN